MFQWETHVSLGVLLVLIIVIIVPRSVFTKSSSIKLYKEDKRLLFNSDPWPPAEQKLEMPCDRNLYLNNLWYRTVFGNILLQFITNCFLAVNEHTLFILQTLLQNCIRL